MKIDCIYASPLERTRQTAELIADALNERRVFAGLAKLEVRKDRRLTEAGNSFRGCRKYSPAPIFKPVNWKMFLDFKTPGWGEGYASIRGRMLSFVRSNLDATKDKTVLAVSHQAPIWMLRNSLKGMAAPLNPFARNVSLASISKFSIDPETSRLISFSYFTPAAGIR